MDILEEIRKSIAQFDPELAKNEDEPAGPIDEPDINVDNYQDAIDDVVEPMDLNFSMDDFDDEDEDEEDHLS